jgi:hypothetical protein
VDRIKLAEDRFQQQALVGTVITFGFHKREEFLGELSNCPLLIWKH